MNGEERKKQPEERKGAAPWMLTYGDMMTLLLCFFVLLFAMSKIEEEQVKRVFESIRAYFDVKATIVAGPIDTSDTFQEYQTPGVSTVQIRGRNQAERAIIMQGFGEDERVRLIDEGRRIQIGGKMMFDLGSAELREEGKEILYKLCQVLEGLRYRIDVRGHTSRDPADLPAGDETEIQPGKWNKAKWDLSWRRAFNVAYYLTHDCVEPGPGGRVEDHNLDWDRFRITGCADTQPVVLNLHDRLDPEAQLGIQRRVEIILSDETVPYRTEGPRRRK